MKVPGVDKKVGHNCVKCAVCLGSMFGGSHEVNGYGVHCGPVGSIENESVLLVLL